MSNNPIPIVDLFAGPGGLGEGFSSILDEKNERFFRIALSIEKDEFAHKTLTLRSFVRQFPFNKLPEEYYQFVRGEIKDVEELYNLFPEQAKEAKSEAWQFTLGDGEKYNLLDTRIKKALKGKKDFVLIGGPPCQAYSLVGRARRQEKNLEKEDVRVYLYREYYRILAIHKPAVFIMENVKGILSSKVENESIFKQIIGDLQDPIEAYKKLHGQEKFYKSKIHYNIYSLVKPPIKDLLGVRPSIEPKDFVIQSENYGIPQARHRVILLGIRSDLNVTPDILKLHGSQIPIEKVLYGLPKLRSGLSKNKDGKNEWKQAIEDIKNLGFKSQIEPQIWEKMLQVIDNIDLPKEDRGNDFVEWEPELSYKPDWFLDKNLEGVCNSETRSHIKEDLWRYLFVSCFASVYQRSPKLSDFPEGLLPKHLNINDGKFTDRFRVQNYGQPSKTITSHISKDGHYFIHPDSEQCRSFTVREAARIQTFPDNYYFCGPRTQQFHQVGNAVPPLLAKQIAEIVKETMQQVPIY